MTKHRQDGLPNRRNWVGPLAPDAAAASQAAFARAGFADPTLVLNWDAIAGPETARLARPLRLSRGPSGGVLTLKAEPGAAVFLQHDTRSLCERINIYLGHPAVARLKFVEGALATRPPAPPKCPPPAGELPSSDPAQNYSGPDGLREALRKLARARRSRTNM